MEPRRMPLPAAWLPLPQVGTGRDQGSGMAARTDPQIGCLLRRGEPAQRQIRADDVRRVQRRNFRSLPQEATAAPCARPTHGGRTGQSQVPRTTDISPPSPKCSTPSAPASTDGACPIQCCGDYAALFKTLCLVEVLWRCPRKELPQSHRPHDVAKLLVQLYRSRVELPNNHPRVNCTLGRPPVLNQSHKRTANAMAAFVGDHADCPYTTITDGLG